MKTLGARERMRRAALSAQFTEIVLGDHSCEIAQTQREYLRSQGYDLSCVCGGCGACVAQEVINIIAPAGAE